MIQPIGLKWSLETRVSRSFEVVTLHPPEDADSIFLALKNDAFFGDDPVFPFDVTFR